MKDYSPLFNQGLLALASDAVSRSCTRAILPVAPRPHRPSRATTGRSFLNLKTSVYHDKESFKAPATVIPRSATATTFSSSTKPNLPSSPTSPTRRSLPLPKPAPLSSLPAIPISTVTSNFSRPSSPVPSSTLSSHNHRKRASLAPSFFSARSHITATDADSKSISTAYRKRRRQDALSTLEGRRRPAPIHLSFVPSVEEEEDVDAPLPQPRHHHHNFRSHLSFGSSMHPVKPARTSAAIVSASGPKSPSTPCFSIAFAPSPPVEPSRRASTGPANLGWGMNFIDLDDDGASSLWRWSHVA